MDSRSLKLKKFIDSKSDIFISHTENVIFEYGKSAVTNYLECILYAIDQYSSLSSDDVIDILHEVYILLYPHE